MCRAVLASPLIWNCLVAKVDRYRPEKEFRIAILGQRDPLQPAVEFRNRSHDAIIERVPYIPFAYPLKQSGSIAEIVVGPVAPADAEDRVLRCLAALGYAYEIRIRRSTLDW